MPDTFLGEIHFLAFGFPPNGYHVCDGSLLAIASNSALFSLIGTTYGGDGIKDFALPRLPSTIDGGHGLYVIAIQGIYPSRG